MKEIKRQELLARYMVGRYRLGHESIALFLAGTLFESLINSKLQAQGDWDDERLERTGLLEKIDALDERTIRQDAIFLGKAIFTKYAYKNGVGVQANNFSGNDKERIRQVKTRLQNFRWLRNKVMHGQFSELVEDGDGKKEDLINYLWCELARESFEKALNKRMDNGSIVNTLFEHSADYMIRAIDEVEAIQKDRVAGHDLREAKIFSRDFDNLFDLRRRLVPLKNYLAKWLVKHASFLQTDILTTIDTTSSYIWMPLVPRQNLASEKRSGVYDCSVSLLATPLDLRVYMDFGGYNRGQRKMYFDFLAGSPEYTAVVEKFNGKPRFEVFDVDWYSFIFNRRQFSDWLIGREAALADARDKIDAILMQENSPITWNRCLHGYVFPKLHLGEGIGIDFAMIEQPLRDMIEFYQAFQRYKQRVG